MQGDSWSSGWGQARYALRGPGARGSWKCEQWGARARLSRGATGGVCNSLPWSHPQAGRRTFSSLKREPLHPPGAWACSKGRVHRALVHEPPVSSPQSNPSRLPAARHWRQATPGCCTSRRRPSASAPARAAAVQHCRSHPSTTRPPGHHPPLPPPAATPRPWHGPPHPPAALVAPRHSPHSQRAAGPAWHHCRCGRAGRALTPLSPTRVGMLARRSSSPTLPLPLGTPAGVAPGVAAGARGRRAA